jgi:hypothetical protein
MLVNHLNKTLKLSNLIHILLIISFISIGSAFIKGVSIITVCFSANGLVFIYLMLVKIFVSSYNPQITKARVNNKHKSNITLNSGFCMFTTSRNINNFLNSFVSNEQKMKSFKQLRYNHTLSNIINQKSKGICLKNTKKLNP